MQCSGLKIDDIAINYKEISKTRFDLSVNIDDLDTDCELNWRYEYAKISLTVCYSSSRKA